MHWNNHAHKRRRTACRAAYKVAHGYINHSDEFRTIQDKASAADSLTGDIMRNDWSGIDLHLRHLALMEVDAQFAESYGNAIYEHLFGHEKNRSNRVFFRVGEDDWESEDFE